MTIKVTKSQQLKDALEAKLERLKSSISGEDDQERFDCQAEVLGWVQAKIEQLEVEVDADVMPAEE